MLRWGLVVLSGIAVVLGLPAFAPAQGLCGVFSTYGPRDTVTAANLNSNFVQAATTNSTTQCVAGDSASITQMQATVNPFPSSTESLATTLEGELQRLRFVIKALTGWTQWYSQDLCVNKKEQNIIIVTCAPYNAKGDGVTDDTTALRNAYADAKALSGNSGTITTLILPPGVYKFTSQLTWDGAVNVLGVATGDTLSVGSQLKKSGNITGILITHAATASSAVRFSNFVLNSFGSPDASDGINLDMLGANGWMFDNIRVINQGRDGIVCRSGNVGLFQNIQTISNGRDGIRLDSGTGTDTTKSCYANTFVTVDSRSNTGWGFNINAGQSTRGVTIAVQSNTAGGLRINDNQNYIEVYNESNGTPAVGPTLTASAANNTLAINSSDTATVDSGTGNIVFGTQGPPITGANFVSNVGFIVVKNGTPYSRHNYDGMSTVGGPLNLDAATSFRLRTNTGTLAVDALDITSAGIVTIGTQTSTGASAGYVVLANAGVYGFVNGAGTSFIGALAADASNNITLGQSAATILMRSASIATFTNAGGLQMGAPTGADKGSGTINVSTNVFLNGTAYTNPDYVLEHWATGQIVRFATRDGADRYAGLKPLAEVEAFARRHYTLPMIAAFRARASEPGRGGLFDGGDAILGSIEQSYLYLFDHEARLKALERDIADVRARSH